MAIVITDRFRKAYRRLPHPVQERIKKALRQLDENPRHPSLQVKKIGGSSDIYEARVDRRYRMFFQFDGKDKIMRNEDDHDDCLRNP